MKREHRTLLDRGVKVAGSRGKLAEQLGIYPGTIYRWYGKTHSPAKLSKPIVERLKEIVEGATPEPAVAPEPEPKEEKPRSKRLRPKLAAPDNGLRPQDRELYDKAVIAAGSRRELADASNIHYSTLCRWGGKGGEKPTKFSKDTIERLQRVIDNPKAEPLPVLHSRRPERVVRKKPTKSQKKAGAAAYTDADLLEHYAEGLIAQATHLRHVASELRGALNLISSTSQARILADHARQGFIESVSKDLALNGVKVNADQLRPMAALLQQEE
jgi:hypothetical protein